jgi:hypothetical protein
MALHVNCARTAKLASRVFDQVLTIYSYIDVCRHPNNSTSTLNTKLVSSQQTKHKHKRSHRAANMDKKSGLLPSTSQNSGADGEAIYMYAGATIRPGAASQVVEEKIGRSRQERLKRKREIIAAENALAKLQKLQPDDQTAISKVKVAQRALQSIQDPSGTNGSAFQQRRDGVSTSYSISLIKNLGFNPSARAEIKGKSCDANVKRKASIVHLRYEPGLISNF